MVIGIVFFKQKTAYDRRISDWSSDVCSSDRPARLRPFEFDQALADEARDRAADGVDRQPQMIGDVAARHRQRNAADRRQTLRRDQQESRDAFVRVAAAEQEYTLVGAVESALESAVLPGRIG